MTIEKYSNIAAAGTPPASHRSSSISPAVPLALCGALLFGVAAPAHAGWFDNLFGPSTPKTSTETAPVTPSDAKQRLWRLGEFAKLEIVPREAGAPENQQPVTVSSDLLFQQLTLVQATTKGARRPLFDGGELATLVEPLSQALERAGPADDIVLVSTARRTGLLLAPSAVTARFFVRDGKLQMIVHDTQFDFYDKWRGTYIKPDFTYGTRTEASGVSLQSSQATGPRADWLAVPLTVPVAAAAPATAPAPVAMPAAMPSTAAPATAPATVAPAPAAVAPAAAPPARPPLDKAGAEEIERRLETLKRLRDKNLITEEEYQQKRKEVLQLL